MAVEAKRGCGYRKVGGLYMMAMGTGVPCCKMPLELSICPCCGAGIKQTRGWTWIDAGKMFKAGDCKAAPIQRSICPIVNPEGLGKVGLLWIGEKFYKTPRDFMLEAGAHGISRRMSAIPREFKPGETWVLFAHPKAIQKPRKVVALGEQFVIVDPRTDKEEDGRFAKKQDAADIAASRDLRDPLYVPGVFYVAKPHGFEFIVKQSTFDEAERQIQACPDPKDLNKDSLGAQKLKDESRGVKWIAVPDDDKDHAGTVYDKVEEPEEV